MCGTRILQHLLQKWRPTGVCFKFNAGHMIRDPNTQRPASLSYVFLIASTTSNQIYDIARSTSKSITQVYSCDESLLTVSDIRNEHGETTHSISFDSRHDLQS